MLKCVFTPGPREGVQRKARSAKEERGRTCSGTPDPTQEGHARILTEVKN